MAIRKTSLNLDNPADWLRARGEERDLALRRAADRLHENYRRQQRDAGKPINVYLLAALSGSKIIFIKDLPGGGRLLPVAGGFQILISTGLPDRRFRASVAHELGHSLFFSRNATVPRRLFPPTKAEHNFCLDLARHVLGPKWLLEETGIFSATSADAIFNTLTTQLRISRPLAARLMLSDYGLRTGLADRWVYENEKWQLDKGNSFVSPSISGWRKREQDIRLWLRSVALRVLTEESGVPEIEVICLPEKDQRAAFVLVTNQRNPKVALE